MCGHGIGEKVAFYAFLQKYWRNLEEVEARAGIPVWPDMC
jgi:hypothetical protein